jgi:hypothetical protein
MHPTTPPPTGRGLAPITTTTPKARQTTKTHTQVTIMTDPLTAEPPGKLEIPSGLDPIEAAAWFVAAQPGGPAQLLAAYQGRVNGQCTCCGWYRAAR